MHKGNTQAQWNALHTLGYVAADFAVIDVIWALFSARLLIHKLGWKAWHARRQWLPRPLIKNPRLLKIIMSQW